MRYNPALNGKYRWFFIFGLLCASGGSVIGRFYNGPYVEAIAITVSLTGIVLLLAFAFYSRKLNDKKKNC